MARMRMQKSRKNVNFVTAVEFLVGHKVFYTLSSTPSYGE